jgi:uncharacterized surface protein with fasciclin (FAS1) repeats
MKNLFALASLGLALSAGVTGLAPATPASAATPSALTQTVASKAGAAKKVEASKNVVETAIADPQFSTLVAAVQAAGLVEALASAESITLFAPTNAAFEALPAGTVENLLLPENREQLIAILTYHVVPSKVMAADVSSGNVPTLNGAQLTIDVSGGVVTVGGAQVTATDIKASNGVIHVVNRVILPPTD